MERKIGRSYSTGEVAKYFDIKKDTLLYYDRIGLFHPAGVSDNGYRYYNTSQLETLWALLSLRELDVPIKDLQQYFKAPSVEKLHQLAAIQLEKVNQEAEKLRQIQKLLQQMVEDSQEAMDATLGEVMIISLPAQRLIYSEENLSHDATSAEQWDEEYDRFLEQNGLKSSASVGSRIAYDDLKNNCFGRVDRLFVTSEDETDALRPAGTYARLYHQGDYINLGEAYRFLLDEITRLGYAISGDAYEEYLVTGLAAQTPQDYLTKITIAVNKII